MARADVVVDASDNFTTRYAVNQACVRTGRPLVSGAALRFEGQVSVFRPGQAGSPCYACLYNDEEAAAETCTDTGVAAPLLGIIGSVQAIEVLKLLIGVGETLEGRLLRRLFFLYAIRSRWLMLTWSIRSKMGFSSVSHRFSCKNS